MYPRPVADDFRTPSNNKESDDWKIVDELHRRSPRTVIGKVPIPNSWSPSLNNRFASLCDSQCETSNSDIMPPTFLPGNSNESSAVCLETSAGSIHHPHSKRPQILTNERHLANYMPRYVKQRPGYKSYSGSLKSRLNALIVTDSTLNRIRKYEFSDNLKRGRAIIKTQPGEKTNVIHAFLRAKLMEDDTRNSVIIHAGTNNLCNAMGTVSDQSVDDIVKDIIDMGDSCREFGVGKIAFSGITMRRNGGVIEGKRREINSHLKTLCYERGYVFIDNDNVTIYDVENKPRDKVHLLESGSVKLANNILKYLNGD